MGENLRTFTPLKLVALFLLLSVPAFAGVNNLEEQDGSPSVYPWKIKVSNGTLTDNGDGTASLTTGGGGGTPGGSDTQVQFNDASAFGGDAGFTYNKTTDALTLAGALTVDTDTLVVDATNNRVGIGTTDPADNLDVYDATASGIYNRVSGVGANWLTTATQSQFGTYSNIPLQIKTNDTARIYITAGGNVGIGTTGPGAKLEVAGVTGTTKALIANNGTSTGNIFEAQDNGTPVFTVADGGVIYAENSSSLRYSPVSNTLSISADRAQSGNELALVVSSDLGVRVANISHDGSAFFNKVQLSTDLAVVDGGTGLSGGTSGGVPYFNSATSLASSSVFAANAVVIGGGAGAAPSTITADTSTTHFLGSTATSPAFRQIGTGDISGLGTIATQNANNVSISGGSITGITDLAVADGGTGLSSGTSGGILGYTAAGTLASSTALTANALVIGGGAGATPTTITADTTTTHALFATSGSPAFRNLNMSDLNGTLGVANGGTGNTTGTALRMAYYSSATTLAPAGGLISTDGTRVAIGPGTSTAISLDVAGSLRSVPKALTDSPQITPDAAAANFFTVTLAGQPRTLANPLNGVLGQKIIVFISQDSSGSRKIGFGNNYAFGSSITSFDATTTAGMHDMVGFVRGPVSWDVVAVAQGFR